MLAAQVALAQLSSAAFASRRYSHAWMHGRSAGSWTARRDGFHSGRDALGSSFIPAQRDFVEPHRIESVVGFCGLLRSGELFAVILFSRDTIPARSAARFRTIVLDVRSSLFSFDETRTWRQPAAR
jgi:hypothetical protein